MTRACACDRLWRQMEDDVRLRTLPMAAQHLWLRLARLALRAADGILPMGSGFGFWTSVSLAVSAAEAEVKPALETLLARGLVLRDGDDLRLPDLAAATPKAAANRQNGALGGRPRRGETPDQARARRAQGTLLLPTAGGSGETHGKPTAEPVGSGTTTTTSSSTSIETPTLTSVPCSGGASPWVSLGERIAVLAMLDPVRQRLDYRPVKAWLEEGIAAETILAVVAECIRRDSYQPHKVASLNYFRPALDRARAEAAARPVPAERAGQGLSPQALAIRAWAAGGCNGPSPVLRPASIAA